jgi:3D-(3,5/4)-trihydroxycyclohexane-1,2-dione acylhydrolase (decyclizing)
VPVTGIATLESTNEAYEVYQQHKARQRPLLGN